MNLNYINIHDLRDMILTRDNLTSTAYNLIVELSEGLHDPELEEQVEDFFNQYAEAYNHETHCR